MAVPEPLGDRPRLIVVAHPSEVQQTQRSIVAAGITDVLVKPSRYVEPGNAFVINPAAIEGGLRHG